MHIVITLAGHSRRFKEAGYSTPKFLINIEQKTMLEHVLSMFDERDHFHFVLNDEQVHQNPEITQWLKGLTLINSVKVIPIHEKGPVHSVLQIDCIPDSEPIIITYCDFIVEWDYRRFKREIAGYAAAIPAFQGFHPASFGDTNYAYMRVDENNNLLELREKQSFTNERHKEYASTGIYYFANWNLFATYAKKLSIDDYQGLKEGYVSLLANLFVKDELPIKVTEVRKFICWGTPEDLEQYLFWSKYFRVNAIRRPEKIARNGPSRRVNLIPMAGKGARFKSASYRVSKPLISIDSRPMVVVAGNSLPEADKWIFLPRKDDLERHPIQDTLLNNFPHNTIVIPVDHETSGQAATCLLAKNKLLNHDMLLIASCDYKTIYCEVAWQKILDDSSIDAAIWTSRLGACLTKNPNAFAYCVTDNTGINVKKIIEKQTISKDPRKDPLVVGTFWFRRASDFVFAAERAIQNNLNVNGEHYVANSMNLLLKEGRRIVIFDIEQWISFGDPFELDIFYYWEEYFYGKKSRPFVRFYDSSST